MWSLYRYIGDEPFTKIWTNQSMEEYQTITIETYDFSPEVHVFAGMLVPIMSTNTLWFSGKRCFTNLILT